MTAIAKKQSIELPEISFTIKDPVSALTHFLGFVMSATATPFLLGKAIRANVDGLMLFGCILFILGLLLLYGASATYHTCNLSPKTNKILKKFDHLMIFMLIAGTYSPLCLGPLRGRVGYILFAVVWGIAFAGMLFKFLWVTCPKWVSSVLYIGMGWACIFALPMIVTSISMKGFLWLLAGGIFYTVGGVIYALKCKRFNLNHPYFGTHEIFHIFVMAGSICHFVVIYNFLF